MKGGWLFIDTHERGKVRLAHLPVKGRIQTRTVKRLPVNPVAACAGFFPLKEISFLDGVCVVAGPGSFSSIRAGVLTANLLSRLIKKPLLGISVAEAVSLSDVRHRLVSQDISSVPYVAPVYDAEPNITC